MAVEVWLVPVVGIIFVIICASLAIYYGTKKDMLLIEKGLYKPLEVAQKTLMAGLILVGIGVAISIGLYWETGLGAELIGGLVPCFIGIALLIAYLFIREK
jgi:hypothetical protein